MLPAFVLIVNGFLKKLSRVTSSHRFIPEIDGLRFVAILAVVIFHANIYVCKHASPDLQAAAVDDALWKLCQIGKFGVELFFTISGFILAIPFAEHALLGTPRTSLKSYFLRRLVRLEPPYIIALLVSFIVSIAIKKDTVINLLLSLMASVVYCHNAIFGTMSKILFVAWSLEVEVQFYILVPLLTKIFFVRSKYFRRLLLILAIFISAAISLKITEMNLLLYLHYFLVGFLLADFWIVDWKKITERTLFWDIVGSWGWLILILILRCSIYIPYLAPVGIFAAYAGAFRGRCWNWIFTRRWLVSIGGMCYTIYLYHSMILSEITRGLMKWSFGDSYAAHLLIALTIIIPSILAISSILFVYLERPFMGGDWPRKLLGSMTRRKSLD